MINMASEHSDSESEQELFPIEDLQFVEPMANFLYEDPYLLTGVLQAVVRGDLEKIKQLILEGKSANINDNHGNTPLHVAVIRNVSEIVDYLLTLEDITVNSRNFYGETALFLAVKRGHLHLVENIVKANGNVNLPNLEEVTPLHISVKHPEIAHLLVRSGAYIDARDYSGETPLHEAVSEKCIETVCMLLHYNADANVACDNNITPFMRSIIVEDVELQGILLEYVVDFNAATNDEMTILNLALTHTCPYVKDIIDRGADVNFEHPSLNAFLMCLRVPDVEKFSLVWRHFKHQPIDQDTYLQLLIIYLDDEVKIHEYLRVIINSNNLAPLFEDFFMSPLYHFLKRMSPNKCEWLQITSELICLYLCHGYVLTSADFDSLFGLFGYNELLYICLHMDIQHRNGVAMGFSTILYDPAFRVNDLKNRLQLCGQALLEKEFLPYLRISKRPFYAEECTKQSIWGIPSLLELSRNTTRDHLVLKFRLLKSKQYYLFVHNLPISSVYKDILTFRKPVY